LVKRETKKEKKRKRKIPKKKEDNYIELGEKSN
jgi:hypothetical protein